MSSIAHHHTNDTLLCSLRAASRSIRYSAYSMLLQPHIKALAQQVVASFATPAQKPLSWLFLLKCAALRIPSSYAKAGQVITKYCGSCSLTVDKSPVPSNTGRARTSHRPSALGHAASGCTSDRIRRNSRQYSR